ncbi:glycoside hydrolase family 125 protein [Paenibacillus harenae]|uniref:glycoside hydrolase family 125 protein n=1 Tax=Paenibacillus harenae TaxID=306543 RepID=UPI00279307E0|nr:glycoside hydrolase family 125 protein [Paenibacillus harenae]MDQ0062665.1 meiotically up-regulated gene 157 (Mug157) protein [Paenibacillus harenae]
MELTTEKRLPESVKNLIAVVREKLPHCERIADMFERCLSNTWNTTIRRGGDGTTFVITGDIPAMWLRDSAAQVRPFLLAASGDDEIADMIEGLVERQFRYIIHDPYANAFNEAASGKGHQDDKTEMTPWIWERKYEIDSLCYPIQLSYLLWKNTGRTSQFGQSFRNGAEEILKLWTLEQNHDNASNYTFERFGCPDSDTLPREGKGTPVGITGMTWSGFRPSDDACQYGYLIPANMFAVTSLRRLTEIARQVLGDDDLADRAAALADEIRHGIEQYAKVEHPSFGTIYAYETDGLGHYNLMDDANVPSLLSIPYLGYASADDPIYVNTRRFILSASNPYYYEGAAASGIGSPHTPDRYIWPIALAMQGLTAKDQAEKEGLLDRMAHTDAGTGFMHESFHADDPAVYTRPWFSWANMMFCELVLDVCGIRVRN